MTERFVLTTGEKAFYDSPSPLILHVSMILYDLEGRGTFGFAEKESGMTERSGRMNSDEGIQEYA
jgi:hypothetical protein